MERESSVPLPPGSTPIRHVGVCLDRSPMTDRVLPHGIALARAFGARLTVLHALEPPPTQDEGIPIDPLEWEMRRAEARRHLAALEAEHGEPQLPIATELLEGRPPEEIRDWVRSHGVDLTVLCSHGASGWTEWSLASTARKILEGVSGSMLLVPAWSVQAPVKRRISYRRILVPLDGSPRAESALPIALRLARSHDAELLLLHVVARPECSCPGLLDEEDRDLEQRLVDRNARAAELYLSGLRDHVAREGLRVRILVRVDGDTRGEILRRVTEEHVDLVVASGHGRGARAELPFGSVVAFLLEHATAPVLIVRERSAPTTTSSRPRSRSHGGVRLPPLATS